MTTTAVLRRARYDFTAHRDVRIPTADPQVTLSADLYLPVSEDPVPALVTLFPYRKDFDTHYNPSLRWFAEHGYACLLVDIRGTGSSDGARRPELDPGEADDAVAAIDWAAAEPWCDGNVGMWGTSYAGFTTLRAATQRPANLKAIMPIICPLDPERDVIHPGGARGDLHALAFRGGMMLAQQLLPPLLNFTSIEEQRRWWKRLHETEPVLLDFARHRSGDPAWRRRAIDAREITVPAFCVGGWRDKNADAVPRTYEQIQGPKKLLMGPWMHSLPQDSPFAPIDFLSLALRWWNHWLRGIDDGVMDEPPVTLYLQGHRAGWRSYGSWPPPGRDLALATGADTTLTKAATDADTAAGAIAEYEPDPTIGTLSGLWGLGIGGYGLPLDQHDDDCRAVSATSHALPDDVLLCGRAKVDVTLVDTAAPERLVVRLTEVDPDDRSTLIATGLLAPDEPRQAHSIVLWATGYRVRAGNRLRVALSDSDFPRLTPLPNPAPIRPVRIWLSLPAVRDEEGTRVEPPALERPRPETLRHAGRWAIIRDPINDEVSVVIGGSTRGVSTTEGHMLESDHDVRATVRRAAPGAAATTNRHEVRVRMNTGETIDVAVTVRCTQTEVWARGEVGRDGITTFSRIWTAVLE